MITLHPALAGQPARLQVDGELTVLQAAEARAELLRLCPPLAGQPLDIDLAGLAPADTATVQLLLALAHSLRLQGSPARLAACSGALQSMAQALGAADATHLCGLPLVPPTGART